MKQLDPMAVRRFLFDLNTRLWIGMECRQQNEKPHCFDLQLKKNECCSEGIVNPTSFLMELVLKLGRKHFNAEADFNNTGTTFWFISD